MTSLSHTDPDITQFEIVPIDESQDNKSKNFLGYYVTSTAPINAEDEPVLPNTSVKAQIREMAQYLIESKEPQLIVAIHGYATKRSEAEARHRKIYNYATSICEPKNYVFLGYRWPSENPFKDDPDPKTRKSISFPEKLQYALQSLPTLLIGILISGLILSLIATLLLVIGQGYGLTIPLLLLFVGGFSIGSTLILLKLGDALHLLRVLPVGMLMVGLLLSAIATFKSGFLNPNLLLVPLLILFLTAFAILLALILLRLSTYLRDNYRATNFGVLDLVELIRQLDQAVFEAQLSKNIENQDITEEVLKKMHITREKWEAIDGNEKIELWKEITASTIKKIKLNFLGHSMGCFVVTNTIRILSDVFAPNSINKHPDSNIGRVFSLGRLILVAPDIPTETIMPRRANFLRSSLRRCEEAYVFTNEGDLALRLASTAANYFSFPAKTRFSGYRLGNLTVKHFDKQTDHCVRRLKDQDYGIVNEGTINEPYLHLEIRASNQEHRNLDELRSLKSVEKEKINSIGEVPVTDLFTYFDCTDYIDFQGELRESEQNQGKPKGVVSNALRQSALNLWDYASLSLAYFNFNRGSQGINVHGGYFDGKFSQKAMYQLAFLGFRGFLENLQPGCQISDQLNALSAECRKKQIQVVLSPWVMKRQ